MARSYQLTDRLRPDGRYSITHDVVQRPSSANPIGERVPDFDRGLATVAVGITGPSIGVGVALFLGGPVVGPFIAAPLIVAGAFGIISGTSDVATSVASDVYSAMSYFGLVNPSPSTYRAINQANYAANAPLSSAVNSAAEAFGLGLGRDTGSGFYGEANQNELGLGLDYSKLDKLSKELSDLSERISADQTPKGGASQSKVPATSSSDRDPWGGGPRERNREPRDVDPHTDDRGWMNA